MDYKALAIELFSDRRRFKRLNTVWPIHLRVVEDLSLNPLTRSILGILRELTPAGARIEVNTVMVDKLHLFYDVNGHPGRWLEITLETPDKCEKISLPGRVVWYDRAKGNSQSGYIFGLEIKDVKPEERKRIRAFLHSLRKKSQK